MKITEIILEYKDRPTEDFGGLKFRMTTVDGQLFVNALDPDWGNELGHVTFTIGDSNELDPQDLFVKDKYRNQGIAKIMYDFVKSKGYKIVRSWDQTDAGAGFWDKHRGEDRVWEEVELQKGKWQVILSNADKQELGDDLVNLVGNAYGNTEHGSFVNSVREVIPSDWQVLDWDNDPGVDACVFYRKARGNESWRGYKIQGIGHDGQKHSKNQAVNQVHEMLQHPGTWIESSDALRTVLKRLHVQSVTDVRVLKRLFNDSSIQMIDRDTYTRKLSNGQTVTETVFGQPRF